MVPVECYFVLSALLFFIGVYGFVTRRNLIAMLISIELVLNAVDINFAAFNRLLFPGELEGFFMTLFSIGVSAAESAVAIAIIINVFRNFKSDSDLRIILFDSASAAAVLPRVRTGWHEDAAQDCWTHRHLLAVAGYCSVLPHGHHLFHGPPYGRRYLPDHRSLQLHLVASG